MTLDVKLYQSDNSTLVTTLTFGSQSVGVASASQQCNLWYKKGSLDSGRITNVRIVALIESPYNSGTYVETGALPADERHLQMQVSGLLATGDPTMAPHSGGWRAIGGGVRGVVPDISANCMRSLFFRILTPLRSGSTSLSVRFKILVYADEVSLSPHVLASHEQGGILRLVGNADYTGWLDAGTITTDGSDTVVMGSRRWAVRGVPGAVYQESVTLNQTSGSGALGSGEEYQLLLSQAKTGGAYTSTKGSKAATGASVAPNVPADSIARALFLVSYDAGGSAITDDSILWQARSHLMQVRAGTGLVAEVDPGRAVTPDFYYASEAVQSAALPASSTRFLWLTTVGALSLTTTEAAGFDGDELLAEVTTDGSGVTGTPVDRRRWREPHSVPFQVQILGEASTGEGLAYVAIPFKWSLDRVEASHGTPSVGATGATWIGLSKISGGAVTDLFTAGQGGTPETRLAIAAQATVDNGAAFPQILTGSAGDVIRVDVDTVPAGASTQAADIFVTLWMVRRS